MSAKPSAKEHYSECPVTYEDASIDVDITFPRMPGMSGPSRIVTGFYCNLLRIGQCSLEDPESECPFARQNQ